MVKNFLMEKISQSTVCAIQQEWLTPTAYVYPTTPIVHSNCFYNIYSTHSLQLEIAVSSVGIGDSLVRAGINTHCVAVEGIYKLFLEKVITEVDAYHMTITTTRWSSA